MARVRGILCIALIVPQGYGSDVSAPKSPFWRTQPGLIWSNPDAGDSVHIRVALLRPRFEQLLEIAVAFGLHRVREEWAMLQSDATPGVERAGPSVDRILRHIEEGFACAATRD